MAGALTEELKNLTDCCICNEELVDPRSLPCLHTFCLKCLETSEKNKRPKEEMFCPLCRKEFVIPRNGLEGLPKNFFVERLKEMNKSLVSENTSEKSGYAVCDICLKESRDTSKDEKPTDEAMPWASFRCTECDTKMCAGCAEKHRELHPGNQHFIVNIDLQGASAASDDNKSICLCDLHPAEEVRMFCKSCKVVSCDICAVEMHEGHDLQDIVDMVKEFEEKLNQNKAALSCLSEAYRKQIGSLGEYRVSCLGHVNRIIDEVVTKSNEIQRHVESRTVELLDTLKTAKHRKLKDIEADKVQIELELATCLSYTQYIDQHIKVDTADVRNLKDLSTKQDEMEFMVKKMSDESDYMKIEIPGRLDFLAFLPDSTEAGNHDQCYRIGQIYDKGN